MNINLPELVALVVGSGCAIVALYVFIRVLFIERKLNRKDDSEEHARKS